MKQNYYFLIAVLASLVCISSSVGRNDKRAGAPGDNSCNACHQGASASGSTNLLGLPNAYVAGEQYDLILTVEDSNMKRAGFQIVATDGNSGDVVGTFTPGNNSRLTTGSEAGRLTHSSPLSENNGIVEFNFKWEAPSENTAPENIVFYYNMVAANGNGGTTGDAVYQGSTERMTLPIRLASFDIEQSGNSVNLSWEVLTEYENARFEIERSIDAQDGEVISVLNADESSNNYSFKFTDQDPIFHQDSYYRLKLVDEDGLVTYSEWESIMAMPQTVMASSIYPNPLQANNALNMSYHADADMDVTVMVHDLTGKVYQQVDQLYQIKTGQNNVTIPQLNIDKSGMYLVNLVNAENKQTLSSHRLYYQGDK